MIAWLVWLVIAAALFKAAEIVVEAFFPRRDLIRESRTASPLVGHTLEHLP